MAQSEQQLATLKNKLQMPMVVRDLLVVQAAPEDDTLYALHEMMSNYSPEDALLCAAFTMKEIAAHQTIKKTDLAFLHMESERIIERYSARDDLAGENPQMWSESQADMIDAVSEDLESFLDLVSMCHMSFEITAPKIADILHILETQLQAQLVIVDAVIELKTQIDTALNMPAPTINGYDASNVVRFPG